MNTPSLPAAPDIAEAANQMDAHARRLDQDAALKAAEAEAIKKTAADLAKKLIAEAKHAAALHVAEQNSLALPAEDAARKLRIQADYWRSLAGKERESAEITAPEQPPFARTLTGADSDDEPKTWTAPNGLVWDLHVTYVDSSGQRWTWAGGFESVDGSNVLWPLMSHDDYSRVDVPLCRCPVLLPAEEANQTGQFPAARPGDATEVIPAVHPFAELAGRLIRLTLADGPSYEGIFDLTPSGDDFALSLNGMKPFLTGSITEIKSVHTIEPADLGQVTANPAATDTKEADRG